MRRLWLLVAFVALPLAAWGLSLNVSFRLPPLLNKIRPAAIVDESGNVLFGSTPAKVEVTNGTLVAGANAGEPVSFFLTVTAIPIAVATVPNDRALIITDWIL